MLVPSLQDFSIVNTLVDRIQSERSLPDGASAFYYFVLDSVLRLQPSEIDDFITDNNYLRISGRSAGHDRGVDALYIDANASPITVHIFNCKYVEQLDRTDRNFPSSETDKLIGFLGSLMQHDSGLSSDVNATLYSKVEEIWSLFRSEVLSFQIHLCSNIYRPMERNEDLRLKRELTNYSHITLHYHLMSDFVSLMTHRDKVVVDAKVRADQRLLFERTDGDIRALIISIGGRDLLRIVCDDESLRTQVDLSDYSSLASAGILEDAFEGNVRLYLRQYSKINRNIKDTALSDLRSKFFYFNNGITITCSRFEYAKIRFPIVEISNLQIVNGGQTIHALFEAFRQSPADLEQIEVLCRIYETNNAALSTNIAEYTNSQNPVKSRDIRSNDYIQKKLEVELAALGLFYERKRNQFADKPPQHRIDSERAGQALMAFFNEMPAEAKDKKSLIFAEKYDDVFNDDINARKVRLVVGLLDEVERRRGIVRDALATDPLRFEKDSFVLHASFYFLYAIKRLATVDAVDIDCAEALTLLDQYYSRAKSLLRSAVTKERSILKRRQETYNHRVFFKGNRPRVHLDAALPLTTAR